MRGGLLQSKVGKCAEQTSAEQSGKVCQADFCRAKWGSVLGGLLQSKAGKCAEWTSAEQSGKVCRADFCRAKRESVPSGLLQSKAGKCAGPGRFPGRAVFRGRGRWGKPFFRYRKKAVRGWRPKQTRQNVPGVLCTKPTNVILALSHRYRGVNDKRPEKSEDVLAARKRAPPPRASSPPPNDRHPGLFAHHRRTPILDPASQWGPGTGHPAPARPLERSFRVPPTTDPFRPGPGREAQRKKGASPMTRAPPLCPNWVSHSVSA